MLEKLLDYTSTATRRPSRTEEETQVVPPPSPSPSPSPSSNLVSFSSSNPLVVGTLTTILITTSYLGYQKFGKRIRNVDELGQYLLVKPGGKSKTIRIRGVVTSVGDADNFRMWHRPLLKRLSPFTKIPTKRKELKGETIHVRLAGVDAPEMAHFGKPAQPFSQEAFEFLNKTLLHKSVTVELHQRDRYSRVVGTTLVRIKKFPFLVFGKKRNVSEEMLKLGLAEVYERQGAVYGGDGKFQRFKELEKIAKRRKLGMWSLKNDEYESPSEYKRRHSSE